MQQIPQNINGAKEGQTLVNEFGLPPPLMRCFEVCHGAIFSLFLGCVAATHLSGQIL